MPAKSHGATAGRKGKTALYRTFRSWLSMKQRCLNPRDTNYAKYGGRGVKVCDRWRESFETFLADMGEMPDGCTLDRKDTNGDYEPDNCQWANRKAQTRNRRNTKRLTVNGETKTLGEWADLTGMNYHTLSYRLRRGWSPEQALTTPPASSGSGAYRTEETFVSVA